MSEKIKSGDDKCKIDNIILLHISAIILWIFIIIALDLHYNNIFLIVILSIPFINFGLIIFNSDEILYKEEGFNSKLLAIGLFILIPLLTILSKDMREYRKKFIAIAILAIILTLFTYVDFWLPKNRLYIINHIDSILQTIALTLIIYLLYGYYEIQPTSFLHIKI